MCFTSPPKKVPESLKVHILYEHGGDFRPYPCSYIRTLLPLSHPVNSADFHLSWGVHYEPADVLIVERFWKPVSPWSLDLFIERVRSDGACLIYAIDDNLLDLSRDRLFGRPVTIQEVERVRHLAREADAILVSTPLLKERFKELNDRIYVILNALDERLFVRRSLESSLHPTGRKVIGFMGTASHDVDLAIVTRALRKVLKRHCPDFEFQLVGGCSEGAFLEALEGLPVRVLHVGENSQYPKFVQWMTENVHWDLAIAPLAESPFALCKSDIKFLDYSTLGIAGIYSRVPAYGGTVRHLETGYLVENDSDAWQAAMEELLGNDSLRLRLSRNAEEDVRSNRMLEQNAHYWGDAITSIVSGAPR